jgi:hypothetical protein
MANKNLRAASSAKNDEFYTQYSDIEKEMNAYLDLNIDVFRDKTILLPCDDPEWSNFTKYFAQNFDRLGLKRLISTSFAPNSKPVEIDYQPTLFEVEDSKFDKSKTRSNGKIFTLTKDTNKDGVVNFKDIEWKYLEGDGDFRSSEIKKIRDESDIIITNPPFSLFREFLGWVLEGKKDFVLIGNMNAITYKELFPLIKENQMWLGATNFNEGMYFFVPEGFQYKETYKFERQKDGRQVNRVPGVCWFTTLDHGRRHQPIPLMSEEDNINFSKRKEIQGVGYRKYDNFDAVEVPWVDGIPSDFEGYMGVPITFLGKYSPEQFEIIAPFNAGIQGEALGAEKVEIQVNGKPTIWNGPTVGGVAKYYRIIIRHKGVNK